jgi:urea transporter
MLLVILLCSKLSFVWALVSITLTWLLAQSLNYSNTNILNGLCGFSAVLTAIALQNIKPVIFPLTGIVLTVFVSHAFILSGWPSLTAPFVFVLWVVTVVYIYFEKVIRKSP